MNILRQIFFKNGIYFWLHWVFVPVQRLSLVVASRGCSLFCAPDSCETGFSHCGVWALGQRGFCISSVWALEHRLVVVLYRLICPEACEIFPDQKSNPCPLHWQGKFYTPGPPVSSQASLLVDMFVLVLSQ